MPKLRPDQYCTLILLIGVFLFSPPYLPVVAQENNTIVQYIPLPILNENLPSPKPNSELLATPVYSAQSYIIYDLENGAILSEKNIHSQFPQASLTKLMTALIVVESYDLEDIVTITHNESLTPGNSMELQPQEKIKVKDLLQGLLIYSANDAAMALAHHHPLGYEGFIEAMNTKARMIHLNNTHFVNPTGFDEYDHYSSAFDIVLLAKETFKYPQLSSIMESSQFTVTSIDGLYQHSFPTTNQLLNQLEGLVAGKTGSTLQAGECLMTMTQRESHPIITVILGSKNRFSETTDLVNWVYNMYEWKSPLPPEAQMN